MTNKPKEHFKISETPEWTTQEYRRTLVDNSSKDKRMPEDKKQSTYTYWLIGSWLVILFNTIFAALTVRDMFLGLYNPINHYSMIAAFTGSLGALALIEKYIVYARGK